MLYHMEEYGKYVAITGYRTISFERVEAYLKASRQRGQQIQFFDADLIASREHLYFAALNALSSFRFGTNVSKSLAMETILYAAAARQIQKAIDRVGIKPQTTNAAVAMFCDSEADIKDMVRAVSRGICAEQNEEVLEMRVEKIEKIKVLFGITDIELKTIGKEDITYEAVVDLVIERVALLATQL